MGKERISLSKIKQLLSIREKIAEDCFRGSKMILPFSKHLSEIVSERYPNKKIRSIS